jgi:cephalosporin-C deacetylase-like acetyl esterase
MLTSVFAAQAADPGVSVTKAADGSVTATTANYTALVGTDGNLRSLNCGGQEFLLDRHRGMPGSGYIAVREAREWSATAFTFDKVDVAADTATVTATGKGHTLTYRFAADAIELGFTHTEEPHIWLFVLNPAVKDMLDRESGEPIAYKSVRECTPQLFAPNGANVTFPAGSCWYIGRNAQEKPDTDPMLDQVWMPRTAPGQVLTKKLVLHAKPTPADALRVSLRMPTGNHILPPGAATGAGFTAKLAFPGVTAAGQWQLDVKDFLTKATVFSQGQPFALAENGELKPTWKLDLAPGFYEATLTLKQGEEILNTRAFPLAVDLEHMILPPRPGDFDAFWDATLAEQAKIPANLQLTVAKEEPNHTLYKFRFDGLMDRQFHGWLAVPKTPGKYAAHLTLPPSGIHPPYMPYAGANVVGMSLAIAGQEPEPPPGGYKHWDYWRSGIESRETWYYRAVFAACSRAVDLLAERPEVDPAKICVTGGSQGGGLSFIAAGLNPKVGMAICGSPGLFGLEWKLRHFGYTYWPPIHIGDDPTKPVDPAQLEARIAVVRYCDAANFAPRIRGAVLLNLGMQDHVTAPAGALAAWPRLTQAKARAILVDPWGGHNGPRGGQWLSSQWFATLAAGTIERLADHREAGGLPVLVEVRTSK